MKRASRIAFAVIAVVVGLGAAGIAILKTLDFNQYREFVAEKVFEATGRKLDIAGDLDLAISFSPSLRLEGVTLANAEWGSRPEMVTFGRLDAQVELIPLLSGEARINRIVVSDLDALVETNAEGQGNWQFGETSPPAAGTAETGEALPVVPVVDEVVIENAKVTYRDGATGQSHEVTFESLKATTKGPQSPIDLVGKGLFAGAPFRFDGQVGNIAAVTAGDSFPFALKASALAAELSLEGVVEKPLEGRGIDVKAGMEAPDLAQTLGALAGAGSGPRRALRSCCRGQGVRPCPTDGGGGVADRFRRLPRSERFVRVGERRPFRRPAAGDGRVHVQETGPRGADAGQGLGDGATIRERFRDDGRGEKTVLVRSAAAGGFAGGRCERDDEGWRDHLSQRSHRRQPADHRGSRSRQDDDRAASRWGWPVGPWKAS